MEVLIGGEPRMADEMFELVDDSGKIIGQATRRQCHGNPALRHRSVHVVVFDRIWRVLLQKRSASKDVQPGKWDSAVGGHLMVGEDYETAARREMSEELGVDTATLPLKWLFDMSISNEIESESVKTFGVVHEGPFAPKADEIDEIRFWTEDELRGQMSDATFTPNCVIEVRRLLEMKDELRKQFCCQSF